jgi:hypothetical protein
VYGIPNSKPAMVETNKKARNGLTFAQVINITRLMMQHKIIIKVMLSFSH